PSPTSAIRPVPSDPTMCGYSIGYTPERRYVSMKFTPAASTLTSTSPGPGFGVSISPNSRTSGPPACIARTAWVMTPPAYKLIAWYGYTYERSYGCRLRCYRIRRGRGPPAEIGRASCRERAEIADCDADCVKVCVGGRPHSR